MDSAHSRDGGRWTIGPKGRPGYPSLEKAVARNAVLKVDVVPPPVNPSCGRSLRVQCGCGAIREFTFPPGDMVAVRIAFPVDHRPHPAALRIRFWVPDAVSADTLGFQDERRALRVRVYSLLLTTSRRLSKDVLWPATVSGNSWLEWWRSAPSLDGNKKARKPPAREA